jgi:catechol 2,3-dioxygenase-like lactoylglutathione lyase family enzyme
VIINVASVVVDDQARAPDLYTSKLGFVKKLDVPAGEFRWLTVVSPDRSDGVQLLLEPNTHPAAGAFQEAIVGDGLPATFFGVEDVQAERARLLEAGVTFVQPPTEVCPVTTAILDDTCANLIQIASM